MGDTGAPPEASPIGLSSCCLNCVQVLQRQGKRMPGHMPTILQKPSQHLDVPCQAKGLDGRYWRSTAGITYPPFFVLSELCASSSATRQAHAGPHANDTADAFSAPRRPVPSKRFGREILALRRLSSCCLNCEQVLQRQGKRMPGHMPTTLQKPSQHLDVPCQAKGLDGRYWSSAAGKTYPPFSCQWW